MNATPNKSDARCMSKNVLDHTQLSKKKLAVLEYSWPCSTSLVTLVTAIVNLEIRNPII